MKSVDEKKPEQARACALATDGGYSYAGSAGWGDSNDGYDQLNGARSAKEARVATSAVP